MYLDIYNFKCMLLKSSFLLLESFHHLSLSVLSGAVVNNPPVNAGDTGSIPGSGRYPRGGNGNPLQYSCLENPTDRGVGQSRAHGVTKSQIRLSTHTHRHTHTHCLVWISKTLEEDERV